MAKTTVIYALMGTNNHGSRFMLRQYPMAAYRAAQYDYTDYRTDMFNNGLTTLELLKVTTTVKIVVKKSTVYKEKHAKG